MISLFLVLVVGIFGAYKVYPVLKAYYDDSREIALASNIEDFKNTQTGYIYDRDGAELLRIRDKRDVVYLEYDEIPQEAVRAVVAVEDRRFFEHDGVDWLSTGKAAMLLFENHGEITRGGSTITQQLARNIYLSFTTSYERKIREIFLALELEKIYSKEQILEFYLNNINFANSYYGIGAASNGYFGKELSAASLSEIAFLCAIPNNPNYYDPRTNYSHTMERRNVILKCMLNQDFISETEYRDAINAVIVIKEKSSGIGNDFAASFALDCAVSEFMAMDGFSFEYSWQTMGGYENYVARYNEAYAAAKDRLRTGGYKIYTSLSSGLQDSLQEILDEKLENFTDRTEDGSYEIQGAFTVIDNETGLVAGLIGGRGGSDTVLGLNRACRGYKQPGSCIKPLVVYLPVLESGYSAKSIVEDSPIEDGPSNSDGRYLGRITLREAVEKSRNTVAWRLFEEITPGIGLQHLAEMHFSKIVPEDYIPAAALGGLTYGVTTVEMAGAYAAIMNDGVWREPTCIIDIKDSAGNSIYQETQPKRIYSKLASNQMTDILMGVTKHGTASRLSLDGGHEAACKTGTINDNKAAWFCGYTHYYTVSVYVGADDYSSKVSGLYGNSYPMAVWESVQNLMLAGKEAIPLLEEAEYNMIQDVTAESEPESESEPQPEPQLESQPEPQSEPKIEPQLELQPEFLPEQLEISEDRRFE